MFKKKKYTIIKKAVSKELCLFLYNYLLIKRQVAKTMFEARYLPAIETDWGHWKDEQVPNTYCHYADIAMETLMLKVQPLMEKYTKLKLYPTYSYMRVYEKGAVLRRHKDRFSCEISTTMNIGGDNWPIYLEPSGEVGKKGIKVNLKPGDMLIYKGELLEHWRDAFEGNECAQVFFHFNNVKTPNAKANIFDTRPHIGLPSWFKK